ncbi:MAG: alanine--tRNA ligase [Halobacteriovoraceae bacterium]|nr:alanine--tRNA ligase [Halobacteriovoraceae bacterium]
MNSQEIRKKFIKYFQSKGHREHPSSSTIPENDPSLLFTNAGMNQFKNYFTGNAIPKEKMVTTIQKCIRAGGKHNDLENVGFTARHHTFFEMLGNFSFGGYFKKEAIEYSWEFLTEWLKIPMDKLYISVHHSDEEALKIWNKIGIPTKKIFKKGDKDNFWEMGELGPCGPCSEIFYDHGEKYTDKNMNKKKGDLLDDESRFVEIWNLVFMQYEKTKEGKISLPKPSIDTGAGLERITAALQNVYWNYDTDIFIPLIKLIQQITGKKYNDQQYATNMRIIADHIRSTTILITDGVTPSNEGRGYVLRRIIRRAVKNLKELGCNSTSLYKLVPTVFETLGSTYPQNETNAPLAEKTLQLEEEKFLDTLDHGLKYLDNCIKNMKDNIFPGEDAFKLYDTFGLPLDMTENILKEKKIQVDKNGFEKFMNQTKERSRKSWKGENFTQSNPFLPLKEKHGDTHFIGYENYDTQGKLLAIYPIKEKINALVFDQTPFYGESGGQIGDSGNIYQNNKDKNSNPIASIYDTQMPLKNFIVHYSMNSDKLKIGKTYSLKIDNNRRSLIAKNHSATHLLQAALIKVLGTHIRQAGSFVNEEKLRFDYTHMKMPSKEDLDKIESLVNEQINKCLPVEISYMKKDEAIQKGALAFFGEKYDENVRVLTMGNFSTELCGGTHVNNTSQISIFTITSESSLSLGVRRLECLTGENAINYLLKRTKVLEEIESISNVKGNKNLQYIQNTLEELKEKNREIHRLKDQLMSANSDQLFSHSEKLKKDIVFVAVESPKNLDMRKLSDNFINKNKNGIILLYNTPNEMTVFLLRSASHLKIDCSSLLKKSLAKINGKGGGRPDIAQGSGKLKKTNVFIQELKEEIVKVL